MINLWRSSYIFINIKCSYRIWHKIVKKYPNRAVSTCFPCSESPESSAFFRLRTVHPNHAAGPFDWADILLQQGPQWILIRIYIYRDVEYEDCLFVILLVFMTSYYVSMCLQHLSIIYIYHHIPIYNDSSQSPNWILSLHMSSNDL